MLNATFNDQRMIKIYQRPHFYVILNYVEYQQFYSHVILTKSQFNSFQNIEKSQ